MKYLVYARRNGEMGEECRRVYGRYEIIEAPSKIDSILNWWELHKEDDWHLSQNGEFGAYYIKHEYGFTNDIIVVPLRSKGVDSDQELDELNINI